MSQENEKEPAISPRVTKGIAAALALVIAGGFAIALTMLVVWGLVSLYGLLFG